MKTVLIGDYQIGKDLGEGSFSKVKMAVHNRTGAKLAVKIIVKSKFKENTAQKAVSKQKRERKAKFNMKYTQIGSPINSNSIDLIPKINNEVSFAQTEIQLLLRLNHPHIVNIYQIFDTPDEIMFLMDYAPGGDFVSYLDSEVRLPEKKARYYFRQLISAIDHSHLAKVSHRDLKLENLLLDRNKDLLVSDFGLGSVIEENNPMQTFCGTPKYASIEIITGIPFDGTKADIWAMGVILYMMVTGKAPFVGESIGVLYNNIRNLRYAIFPFFSQELVKLFTMIFVRNPADRIDMDSLRENIWTNIGYDSLPPRIEPCSDLSEEELSKRIRGVCHDGKIKIYTINTVIRSDEVQHLRKSSFVQPVVIKRQRFSSTGLNYNYFANNHTRHYSCIADDIIHKSRRTQNISRQDIPESEPTLNENIIKWHYDQIPAIAIRKQKLLEYIIKIKTNEPASLFRNLYNELSNSLTIDWTFRRIHPHYLLECKGNSLVLQLEVVKLWVVNLFSVQLRRISGSRREFLKFCKFIEGLNL